MANSIEKDFEYAWHKFILPLKGKIIFTITGKKNVIIDVNNEFLLRESSNNKTSEIKKEVFKTVYYHILAKGAITRKEIKTMYPNIRASSIIVVVLEKIPFIKLISKPLTLTLNKS